MACEGCEQRRLKLKAMYDNSKESITKAISRLTNRDRKAEQSSVAAEQSVDSDSGDTEQSDTRAVASVKSRRGRAKPT
ncbi:hypothetical protein D9K81_16210 [Acinetobacter chengduensis]|uniref:Uncharacterized protein n=1 Tax=Acinetobacter chengduensis TaxID=2420890 RepID=A0ABX9TSD5_9GAMM|nr:hypothetical protein D9K81_16210 [Acinetobacter chengduensis]